MRFKRILTTVLITSTLVSSMCITSSANTSSTTSVVVNNNTVLNNVSVDYVNGTLLMPAKELMEALGGTFSFNSTSMTGILRQGNNELELYLDSSIGKYNGKNLKMPAPMKISGNRFVVPARFVAEKFGAEVYMSTNRNQHIIVQPVNGKIQYKVVSGDSLWLISQMFGVSISAIKLLNGLTSDTIYVGQKLIIKDAAPFDAIIPAQVIRSATLRSGAGFEFTELNYLAPWANISVVGKKGDWFKVVTPKGNGYLYYTTVGVIQDIADNSVKSSYFAGQIPTDTSRNSLTYSKYVVAKGDTLWTIAEKLGIQVDELAAANNMSTSANIFIGQELKIPVHNIAVKTSVGSMYGEVLDWFKEGQYVFPIGKVGKLTDMETGKSFMVKRTIGATHSDTETLTAQDTKIMKEIFGGYWNWTRRSFILEADGRRYAVSVAGMPHAGIDGIPYLQNVSNRSDNWGYGPNYDRIAGNGMDGHFDMYFLNSLRHKDNDIDPEHQLKILLSGGLH